MKKFLLAAVGSALLGMGVPASAADMAVKAAPPPPIIPIYNWTGFYIGANGGWGSSHNCWDFGNSSPGRCSATAAVIVPEAFSVGKSGIAGKAISLCSDWKHKAIGPTSATRASACSTRRSQPA